jgi:hypothetical protein
MAGTARHVPNASLVGTRDILRTCKRHAPFGSGVVGNASELIKGCMPPLDWLTAVEAARLRNAYKNSVRILGYAFYACIKHVRIT